MSGRSEFGTEFGEPLGCALRSQILAARGASGVPDEVFVHLWPSVSDRMIKQDLVPALPARTPTARSGADRNCQFQKTTALFQKWTALPAFQTIASASRSTRARVKLSCRAGPYSRAPDDHRTRFGPCQFQKTSARVQKCAALDTSQVI